MERFTCGCGIMIHSDLKRPSVSPTEAGHQYSDCFLGLAFLNLDPSIYPL